MTKMVHLYASQSVSRRAKDGEPGKPGISPASYQVSFKLQNHYVYIYVTKTQGETTTTQRINKWNDTLTCNVYINGVYTDYKDSDVMRDSYIDLWAFPSAKTIEIVLKRKSDGQQLAIGNYAIVSEFEIQVNPEVVVFDTDEDGNLTTPSQTATITCLRNGHDVTQSCTFSFDNCAHLNCRPSLNRYTVTIKDITTATIDGIKMPAQNGYAQVQITDEHGEKRYAFVKFQVNISMFIAKVSRDNETSLSQYTEISAKVNNMSTQMKDLPTKSDLTKMESSIIQSARSISMEVVEKSILRRNLLRGSSFGRHGETYLSPNVIIEKNSGIDGVNCIHSSDKYSGTGDGNYIGAFWDSTQGNGVVTNIPIVKGKKYVISCWIKSDNLDLPFCIECLYMKSINQQSRDDAKSAKSEAFKVTEKNKWQKISCVLDTDNADATEYLAVNFWSNNKNVPKVTDANGKTYYPTCHAYICKPMMEEGDTYSGWTLSEEDYDYVGGNLIDNTRLLQKSDNSSAAGALTVAGGEITANGYESEYSVAHGDTTSFSSSSYLELLRWNVIGCVASNQDYVFSFLAKGTGTVSTYLFKDGSPRFFVEGSNGRKDATSADGFASFKLTNEWKRYWVHYYLHTTTEHPLPESLLVRCYADNDVYICKPKLEIGAYMTEFTERKTDLVDKASLKKAGIGITDREVLLYGEQVKVMNNNAIAALFRDGMLNADLIAAKVLESLGGNGARVVINDGIMEFFGSINKTQPNIRFGLNSEGSAVLSYYDNAGNFLYDLGPDGISTMDKQDGSFTEYSFYTSQNLFGITSIPSSYGTMKTFESSQGTVLETFYVANEAYDSHLFPKLNPSRATVTHLYRYHAPRINGKIVADSKNGLTTQELASKADGKYFTSNRNVVFNGNLTNLAVGDFWNIDSAVTNMGNFVSALLKYGESYTKPTYSRSQQMTLIDGSSELGIVSRICSLETTTQYGSNIHAGWE